MIQKLTSEQADALHAVGDEPLPIVDPTTNKIYYVVDPNVIAAMNEQSDLKAIGRGIADMEAGRSMTLEESKRRTEAALREKFGT